MVTPTAVFQGQALRSGRAWRLLLSSAGVFQSHSNMGDNQDHRLSHRLFHLPIEESDLEGITLLETSPAPPCAQKEEASCPRPALSHKISFSLLTIL